MDDQGTLTGLLSDLDRLRAELPELRERALTAGKALWDYLVGGGRRDQAPDLDRELQKAANQVLVAVAGIRVTARAILAFTPSEGLRTVIDGFGDTSEDTQGFQNFFERFDAYVLTSGKRMTATFGLTRQQWTCCPEARLAWPARWASSDRDDYGCC